MQKLPGTAPARLLKNYKKLGLPRTKLLRLIGAIYRGERIRPVRRVDVIFCSDKTIRRLNALYRHKDRATDVLSFEFHEDDFLGEIYISLERAAVQARRFGLTYREELERLLVHGMFHLLGFDHKNRADRAIMEKNEARYWRITTLS